MGQSCRETPEMDKKSKKKYRDGRGSNWEFANSDERWGSL